MDKARGEVPIVLVVEDDVLVRMTLVDFLVDNGLVVIEACTADNAIEHMESDDCGIDLVFSDVKTPGNADGFQVAKWVEDHCPEVPVVLTTGYSSRTKPFGVPMLPKPYQLSTVLDIIRAQLGSNS